MKNLTLPSWRTAAVCATASCLMIAVGGCVDSAPSINVAELAAHSAGVPNAIRFQTEGGPIDAPGDSPSLLTMPDAALRALATDPEIQGALARVRAAEADSEQARLLPNPVLSITVRPRFGPETGIISPAISEDLVTILERPRTASAADRRLRAAASDAITAVLNTLSEVQERYIDIQAGDAQLAVLGERRNLLDRLLKLARARFKVGEGSRLDVTTVEAQSETLQFEIAQQRIDLNESRLNLARLIGQPCGRTDWQVTSWAPLPHIQTTQQSWLNCALRSRPEIQSSVWELAALGDDVALAGFAPWDGATIGVEAERDVNWSVGPAFSFPVPLFDMGQAKHRKAVAAMIEGRHKLTQMRRQVVEEVRKSYDTFAATQTVLNDARSKLLPLQQAQQRQAEAAYKAGESDLTTLLVAQEALEDTNSQLVGYEQEAAVAFIKLQRAVGGPGIAEDLAPAARPAHLAASTTSPSTQHSTTNTSSSSSK